MASLYPPFFFQGLNVVADMTAPAALMTQREQNQVLVMNPRDVQTVHFRQKESKVVRQTVNVVYNDGVARSRGEKQVSIHHQGTRSDMLTHPPHMGLDSH